jgi:hypothetical protein
VTDRWRDRAKCLNEPMNTMFEYEREDTPDGWRVADLPALRERLCWKCPVRVECLREAMLEDYGIGGGLTAQERRQIMQTLCHCGAPIDPRDMMTGHRRFCPNCKPIGFGRSSKVGT